MQETDSEYSDFERERELNEIRKKLYHQRKEREKDDTKSNFNPKRSKSGNVVIKKKETLKKTKNKGDKGGGDRSGSLLGKGHFYLRSENIYVWN